MRGMGLVLAAFVLCSAAPAPVDQRMLNDDWPPAKFTRETSVRIVFVTSQARMDQLCGPAADKDHVMLGCTHISASGRIIIAAPHPASGKEGDLFQRIIAHELAHANGWNATHDN